MKLEEVKNGYVKYLEAQMKSNEANLNTIESFRSHLLNVFNCTASKSEIAKTLTVERKGKEVKVSEKTIGTWSKAGLVLSIYSNDEWNQFGLEEVEVIFGDIFAMVKAVEEAGLGNIENCIDDEETEKTLKAIKSLQNKARKAKKDKEKAKRAPRPNDGTTSEDSEAHFSTEEGVTVSKKSTIHDVTQTVADFIVENQDMAEVAKVIAKLEKAIQLRRKTIALQNVVAKESGLVNA